jgi:hypothetical protein
MATIHRKRFKKQKHVSCFIIKANGAYKFVKCPGKAAAKRRRGKR